MCVPLVLSYGILCKMFKTLKRWEINVFMKIKVSRISQDLFYKISLMSEKVTMTNV